MRNNTGLQDFLKTAGEQIRWKRARVPLLEELESHIIDRREALAASGMEAVQAEAQAVEEMGNPEDIGLALDRVHRPRPNLLLIGCTAALLLSGLVLMYSLGDRSTYMQPMLIYAVLGIAALIGGYFLDYTLLAKMPVPLLFTACGACMLMPTLGGVFFSTAAQLCYALPVLLIPLVYRAKSGERKDAVTMLAGLFACYVAAMLSHSWMSLCIYMTVVCGGMILFAASGGWFAKRKRHIVTLALVPPAAVFLFLCIVSRETLLRRLDGVLHAEDDPFAMGWITLRVRELIGTSRLIGRGGSSELMDDFLRQPNEIISVEHLPAVAVHEYGYILLILMVVLLTAAGWAIVKGIRRQSSSFCALTVLTIGLCFGLRTVACLVCNLGFNLVYLEGIPMFSYCGKLMVQDMLVMGLLLSVFRTESIARDSRINRRIHAQ